ncbi:hypothetical protein HMPREF1544_07181 [Mucor circinelloides 1006PhL]|uniref:Endonuclease/exonuclease/phosphatase domain-containing protein n=1 Tax=Mucor circinelloides f. circinelloides (strain 1006PhL) TaxID=1220926 RepID=S2J7B2_MUCC1|nr:hypothetical protein HMPREF1544_07181 [Mucor circinelloides 1006PhL]
MPQKRILTKKGIVPNPTVVSQPVNSIPEVVPASSTRVTRIPIPRGTKVSVAVVKPSTQQHKPATAANTTAITSATTNIVTETIPSDTSLITSSTGSLADWAIDFQVQLRAMNSRFVASYETRLNEVERLTAENSQLKFALHDAHLLIAQLQAEVKRLNSLPGDLVMSDVPAASSGAPAGVVSDVSLGSSGPSGSPGSSGFSGASGASGIFGVSAGASGVAFSGISSGVSASNTIFGGGNSSVSKYASLPPTSSKPASTSPAPPTSFADAAKKAPKSKPKSKSKPSAKKVEAAVRFFSDYPEEYVQGYRYLYFRSRHRKFFKERVLDVHYPTPMAVALLVHHEYAKELLDTLGKAGVTPLADFDPRDPNILEDPRLVSLTEAERVDKVIEVHQGRLLRGLKYLYQHAGRRPVSIAVATDFFHKEWISAAQLHEFKSTGTFTIGVSDGSGSGAAGFSGSGSPGSPGSGGVFETDNVDMPDADTTVASVSLPGDRMTINTVTQSLPLSSLIFITETWLLPPLRLPTSWQQFHTYGLPVPNMRRGQMGISLLVNPDFPYPVTHIPSVSPYVVLSCQVASTLIHCVYLPPTASFSNSDALSVLRDLPLHSSPSQTNTIICGDLNARHARLLGDTKTTTRGTLLYEWLLDTGLYCWNASFAFGEPTLEDPSCSYATLFSDRIAPFHDHLVSLLTSTTCPDFDSLDDTLTDTIHSLLTDSIGRRFPKPPGNTWFWTSDLQTAFDLRERLHTRWCRSPTSFEQCKRWAEYLADTKAFQKAIRRRRRQSWKQIRDKCYIKHSSKVSHSRS